MDLDAENDGDGLGRKLGKGSLIQQETSLFQLRFDPHTSQLRDHRSSLGVF